MSMIERMARAMFDATNEHDTTWDSEAQEVKTTYLIEARAAIEAMGEPTDEMIEAGVTADWGKTLGSRATGTYRAMIQAALNEKPEG